MTVGAKEKSEHYLRLSLSLSLCPLQHASLFLLLYRAASPHLFFFSIFLRKQTDLLSCHCPPLSLSLSIKGERKGEEREVLVDEAAEQKSDRVQVQGQILKKIFKRKFGGIY